jgi:hypothetical protein
MATSGSTDFSVSRDDLIEHAMKHAGVLGEGVSPSTTQKTEAAMLLNMIVKVREADGMPLWALARGYLLPVTDVSSQAFGTGHIVSSYTRTTLSAAAAANASTISVTSATGFADTYAIGIELSTGDMHWTTINGAPSGTTITLTTALSGAASSGADVYTYAVTSRIYRPKRIVHANRWYPATSVSSGMLLTSREEYYELGNRASEATPSQVYFEPLITPNIYWYPRFVNGDAIIEFTYQRSYEDFDASTDTPDFPQEWYLPIMLELAYFIGAKYGVSVKERTLMLQEAAAYREMALANNYPETSVYIKPE